MPHAFRVTSIFTGLLADLRNFSIENSAGNIHFTVEIKNI